MTVNALGQLTGNMKPWDHVGNITPDFVVSEGIVPSEELRPAAWLPVQLWDKHYEVWKVITAGKLVGLDRDGRVVPTGLVGQTIAYTADDVTAGTVDASTGAAVLTAKNVDLSALTTFMGRTGTAPGLSSPIGVAFYDVFQDFARGSEAYGENPVNFYHHNFRLQHLVAVLTDAYIEMPLVPTVQTATALGIGTWAGAGTLITDFVALVNLPVAANTSQRTPIAFTNGTGTDAATRFTRQVTTRALIIQPGDWFIDLASGVISVYAGANFAGGAYQISYYHYNGAPATVSVFACAVGNLVPGDFLKANADSNFAIDAAPSVADTMGQVWAIQTLPKDYLERVMSAYRPPLSNSATGALPGYDGQFDQTAGTATGGVPSKVHFAGAANLLVRINLFSR